MPIPASDFSSLNLRSWMPVSVAQILGPREEQRSLGLASTLAGGIESSQIVLPYGRGATSWPSPLFLCAAPLSQCLGSLHVQADGKQ